MNRRVLVAYASEFGTTSEIAEIIGVVLRDLQTAVDVALIFDVYELSPYDAAIVGTKLEFC